MAPPKEESQASFAFVAYDGPRLPRDPTVRTLIRRRAMKDVAATRKRTGNYGQHNLRQLPPFLESDSAIEDDSTSPAPRARTTGVWPSSGIARGADYHHRQRCVPRFPPYQWSRTCHFCWTSPR